MRLSRAAPLVWLALLLLTLAALVPTAAAEEIDDGVRRIAKQLRCPICESVSVADSPADLAVQMRGLIRKKLEAGESDQQILDYFVAAYGDSVLLEPPRRGLGWAVWLGPLLALLTGLAILIGLLRVWVRARPVAATDAEEAAPAAQMDAALIEEGYSQQVRRELDAVRGELAR